MVNDETGKITRGVTGCTGSDILVIDAYESGTWIPTEDDDPVSEESRLRNQLQVRKSRLELTKG